MDADWRAIKAFDREKLLPTAQAWCPQSPPSATAIYVVVVVFFDSAINCGQYCLRITNAGDGWPWRSTPVLELRSARRLHGSGLGGNWGNLSSTCLLWVCFLPLNYTNDSEKDQVINPSIWGLEPPNYFPFCARGIHLTVRKMEYRLRFLEGCRPSIHGISNAPLIRH